MTFVFLSFGFVSNFGFRVSRFVRSWRPLRVCERPSLSDSLNPNSTENFKYVWLGFVYHEVHEDHEEFHNQISLCVLRALRGEISLSLLPTYPFEENVR
jgi:hypothetical protein